MERLITRLLLLSILLTGVVAGNRAEAAAIDHKRWKVQSAFQNAQGDILVQFEQDLEQFPAGNIFFFGNSRSLFQIDLKWRVASESDLLIQFEDGALSVNDVQATLSCESRDVPFTRLTGVALSQLGKDLRDGKTTVRMLPEIQEPIYLLQIKGSSDFVYVTAPRFNFHENYKVFIGRLGQWKNIETVESPKDPTWNQAGLIRFKSGGGVYIPAAIDLFIATPKQRGSPTLVRGPKGRIEQLVRPSLKPEDLKRAQVSPVPAIHLASPCNFGS